MKRKLGCKRTVWTKWPKSKKPRWDGYCETGKYGIPVTLKTTVGPYHDGSAYYLCKVSKLQSYGNAYEQEFKAKNGRAAKTRCMGYAHKEARKAKRR